MRSVVDGYRGQWSENDDQDRQNTTKRTGNYMNLVNTYYDLATDFYEYGWGECFHFANAAKNETQDRAIARHEHYLAVQCKLGPGMRALVRPALLPRCLLTLCRTLAAVSAARCAKWPASRAPPLWASTTTPTRSSARRF